MRRRNVMFERGRGLRVEDHEVRDLHLGPDRGAAIGEYRSQEPGEYSDSYYGPGDDYARRETPSSGYTRERYQRHRDREVHADSPAHHPFRRGERSSEPRAGARSWADLGVYSVRPGQSGMAQESFRGRGPKGYRRSDERMRELVCERLSDDPHIDASDIEVDVQNGEITLRGSVDDRTTKWRVEDLVEAATGGTLVHNRLRTHRQ